MRHSYLVLLSSALLAMGTPKATALDCTVVSRVEEDFTAETVSACDHFQGTDRDAYLEWYEEANIGSTYPNAVYLQGSDPNSPENGAAVHWKVDDTHVYLAVAARATGWLGFGLSEAGGMRGTDMVLFSAARPNELVDAYTTDELFPQTDDCAGDWMLVSSNVGDSFLMFETKRLLDTEDPQDKSIINDASDFVTPHRIIAAWGDSETPTYHGLNRARSAIRFFGQGDEASTFKAAMERSAEGSFLVTSQEYQVPSDVVTHYGYTCYSRQDLIDQGVPDSDELNIVGWEPIVEEANLANVHHFILYGSTQASCPNATGFSELFTEMSYVWAPGEKGLALPDYLGAPLFGVNDFQAFMLEVHYDNPTLTPGIVDSSGVRMYYTSQARDQQVGIMSTGDPQIGLFGQAVGDGLSKHEFNCPSSCSEMVNHEVTILREYLHLHETGKRIVNEQIRDGEVLRKASVEHWDFHQNGNAAIAQAPYSVMPGDGFRTTCYYEDDKQSTFGLASAEEMCMAFLYYYPRVSISFGDFNSPWVCGYNLGLPACEASYTGSILASIDELEREFAAVRDECPAPDANFTSNTEDGDDSGTLAMPSSVALSISVVVALGAALA